LVERGDLQLSLFFLKRQFISAVIK